MAVVTREARITRAPTSCVLVRTIMDRSPAAIQGLTLVHFSAQRKKI
jgi:hypothetical protein